MTDRIAGAADAIGVSAAGAPVLATAVCPSGKQLIVYAIGMSFSAAPSASVLAQLVDPDVSPNPVLWEGYVGTVRDVIFPAGKASTPGHNVQLQLGGSGALIGIASIHYVAK